MASKANVEGIDLRNVLLNVLDTLGRLVNKCDELGNDMTIVKSGVAQTNQKVYELLKKRKSAPENSSRASGEKDESVGDRKRSKQSRAVREVEEMAVANRQEGCDKHVLQEQRKHFRAMYEQNWGILRQRFPKQTSEKQEIQVPSLVFAKVKGWPFWPAIIIFNCDTLPDPILLQFIKAKAMVKRESFLPIKFFNAVRDEEYAFINIHDETIVKSFELNQQMYNTDKMQNRNRRSGSKLAIAVSQATAFYQKRLKEKSIEREFRKQSQSKKAKCFSETLPRSYSIKRADRS